MANKKESSKPWWWQQWEWFCHDQHVQLSQCSYVAFCNKSHTSFRCIKHYYTSRDHQTLHTSPTFRVSRDLQQNPNGRNSWSLYRNKRPLQKSAHCVCHKLKTQVKPFQQRNGKTEEEEDSSSVILLFFYVNQNRKNEAKRGRTTYVRRKVAIDLFDKENNNPLKLYSLAHVVPTCTNEWSWMLVPAPTLIILTSPAKNINHNTPQISEDNQQLCSLKSKKDRLIRNWYFCSTLSWCCLRDNDRASHKGCNY